MPSIIKPNKHQWCVINDTVAHGFEPRWFEKSYWSQSSTLSKAAGGRGATWHIEHDQQKWVLRHYYRGGLYARINKDKYLWIGVQRTRSFQEFNVLMHLNSLKLPAPKPVAANVLKQGLFYQADLIMECIDHEMTFAQHLLNQHQEVHLWNRVGSTIAQFHRHHVYHSDLNAHNILIKGSEVFIIDFDKSAILNKNGAWKSNNLLRLKRSIEKVSGMDCSSGFKDQWNALLTGYESV